MTDVGSGNIDGGKIGEAVMVELEELVSQCGSNAKLILDKHKINADSIADMSIMDLSECYNSLVHDVLSYNSCDSNWFGSALKYSWGFGLLAPLMVSAPNTLEALKVYQDDSMLLWGISSLDVSVSGDHCVITPNMPVRESSVPAPRYDLFIQSFLYQLRSLSGRAFEDAIYLRPQTTVSEEARSMFTGNIVKSGNQNSILLPLDELKRPILTANEELFEHCAMLASQKRRDATVSFGITVKRCIKNMMDGRCPGREEVAESLGLSSRVLSARLASENTNFNQLLSEVRMQLAEVYLGHLQLSQKEIAYRLGFSSLSSFHRACRRWFGCSPNEKRLQGLQSVS